MKCPKCIGKLNPLTIELHGVYAGGRLKGESLTESLTIDQCFICNGLWFDKGELEKYMKERMTVVGASSEEQLPSKDLNEKLGLCPKCSVQMVRISAPKDRSVTIDTCEKCEGIWLDDVEIDRLERANVPVFERFFRRLAAHAARWKPRWNAGRG